MPFEMVTGAVRFRFGRQSVGFRQRVVEEKGWLHWQGEFMALERQKIKQIRGRHAMRSPDAVSTAGIYSPRGANCSIQCARATAGTGPLRSPSCQHAYLSHGVATKRRGRQRATVSCRLQKPKRSDQPEKAVKRQRRRRANKPEAT